MREELIDLTKRLISINSVSNNSNKEVISLISNILEESGFENEFLTYIDDKNKEKINLVSRKGEGSGGLAFLIHSDTVPLFSEDQIDPYIEENKIYGRGACDMKGPAAAAILAGINCKDIKLPITYIVTSDEEIGCVGAEYIINNSKTLKNYPPSFGITTEPTELKPIYAHKGLGSITVTATGKAAHSSTDIGESANFKLAPFLYFISKLKEKYYMDKSYQNMNFNPPTNGFNMVISDFNCALNITAPKSRCKISFRAMPEAKSKDIIREIEDEADRLGLTSSSILYDSLYTDPDCNLVKKSEEVTQRKAETVPYLTDAFHFKNILKPIILGPGSIEQAHTKDEYIDIDQLVQGYNIYKELIQSICNDIA